MRFSPAGSAWAVASTAGLLIFSLDAVASFAPYALDLATTPDAVRKLLASARSTNSSNDEAPGFGGSNSRPQFLRALLMSLHLGDQSLVQEVFYSLPTSVGATQLLAQQVPQSYLGHLLQFLANEIKASPHLEFTASWCKALLQVSLCSCRSNDCTGNARCASGWQLAKSACCNGSLAMWLSDRLTVNFFTSTW